MFGRIFAAVASLAAVGALGYAIGHGQGSSNVDLKNERLGQCTELLEEARRDHEEARREADRFKTDLDALLAKKEEATPSEVQPAPAGEVKPGQPGGPRTREFAAQLTRGVSLPIEGTGFSIGVRDVRRDPGGGFVAVVAVTQNGEVEEAAIARSETKTVHGAAITVTDVDEAGATLEIRLP